MQKNKHTIQILLVEDNKADSDLVKEILDGNQSLSIHVAQDGEEALLFLRKQKIHDNAPDIDLVLLDLNLPKLDGRKVLAQVKADANLKRIPIIVLTTSEAEFDVVSAYELNANCYLQKPADLDEFVKLLQLLNEFWIKAAKLPSKKTLKEESYG